MNGNGKEDEVTGTLGFHRDMSKVVFGEESAATKFLDEKIEESPLGRRDKVVSDEGQLIMLLYSLHRDGPNNST